MKQSTEEVTAAGSEKPRLAYAVATVLGIGYLKPGPGTWGSLAGLIIAVFSHPYTWFLLLGKGIQIGMGRTEPAAERADGRIDVVGAIDRDLGGDGLSWGPLQQPGGELRWREGSSVCGDR